MDRDTRIPSLSITPNVPRQTPRTDFGTALAHAAHEVVRSGAGLVGGMLPAGPLVSAAVSSAKAVVASVAPAKAASTTAMPPSGTSGTGSGGTSWDLFEAQKALSEEGQKFNMAYLQLQNELQRESREHNAISNIMKVRHDSAKAAINNIR